MPTKSILILAGLIMTTFSVVPAYSQSSSPASDGAARCNALTAAHPENFQDASSRILETRLATLEDAPTQITHAAWVEATADSPAYCNVQGYVWPNVGIEMRLPGSTWNGKMLKAGCGAFCGSTAMMMERICDAGLRRGYACIASDMGHRSTFFDGTWAYHNLQAKIDYGYRATHVATLAGKALVERYFGAAPKKSYYFGCSSGGRQGMVEAQRFPWDFDGIIAGAPPFDFTRNSMSVLWNARAVLNEQNKAILLPKDVELVHRAVMAKCDKQDGLDDGIIEDPRTCKFDPAELTCKAGRTSECLSNVQVNVVKKLYGGPETFPEEHEAIGTLMPGSELHWIDHIISRDGGPGWAYGYQTDKMRYTAFLPDAGPKWQLSDLDFTRDAKRFGMTEPLYNATNPDLRKFKKAGGKLILFNGWGDQGDFPMAAVDYYETAERTMGGRAATQDFFRLFMVPGMGHCSGGSGAYVIDYLSYLEAWVEKGEAPDKMISRHPKDPEKAHHFGLLPLAQENVKFSRPLYPYPTRAKYTGRGDPNDAANFKPAAP